MSEVPGTEFEMPADLVLLAMGFVSPRAVGCWRSSVSSMTRAATCGRHRRPGGYTTSVPKVFAAGDMRRGQSLVVWAIREGRQCARAVDEFLMGIPSCRASTELVSQETGGNGREGYSEGMTSNAHLVTRTLRVRCLTRFILSLRASRP